MMTKTYLRPAVTKFSCAAKSRGRVNPTKSYTHMMRVADECVKGGGHFTGHSEYIGEVEYVTMTLHWKEHLHVTFARHARSKCQQDN